LPKLKTHTLTTFTGALKNQVGLLPGGSKCAIHRTASTPARLAEAVVDINVAVPFHLGVMDGVVGLEGGGSAKGEAVQSGIVAASTDLVALDAVCCALVGIAPEEVPTTVAADGRGIGRGKLEDIRVLGRDPAMPVANFARPGPEPKRNPIVAKLIYRLRQQALWPVATRTECQQCGTCVDVCPVDAVSLRPWPAVDRSCIYCFACRERCPSGAMKLSCKWYLKPLFRGRAKELPLRHMV
jgi:NAD-dependent dihydropyrimidine dehydrogenase PreA subunit